VNYCSWRESVPQKQSVSHSVICSGCRSGLCKIWQGQLGSHVWLAAHSLPAEGSCTKHAYAVGAIKERLPWQAHRSVNVSEHLVQNVCVWEQLMVMCHICEACPACFAHVLASVHATLDCLVIYDCVDSNCQMISLLCRPVSCNRSRLCYSCCSCNVHRQWGEHHSSSQCGGHQRRS